MPRDGWRGIYDVKSDGTSPLDVNGERVPAGQTWVAQHILVENETNAYTQLRILLQRGSYEHGLLEEEAVAAGEPVTYDQPVYLAPDERLVARLTNTTSGDVIRFRVLGFKKVT